MSKNKLILCLLLSALNPISGASKALKDFMSSHKLDPQYHGLCLRLLSRVGAPADLRLSPSQRIQFFDLYKQEIHKAINAQIEADGKEARKKGVTARRLARKQGGTTGK